MLPFSLLAAASFLSIAGARVVDSLLHVIAADFAVSVPAVATIIAAFTFTYGLNQILLGPLGDRMGKLPLMLGALLAYAAATVLCGLAPSLPTLALARALAGAASAGLIPVGLAYIADNVAYEDRQVAMSRLLNGVVLAQMLAGPVGGVFGQYVGWRGVFFLLSAAALGVAGLLARRLNRFAGCSAAPAAPPATPFRFANYRLLLQYRANRTLLLATVLDGMVFTGSLPLLAPYLRDAFGLSYAQVGILLAFFGLGAFVYTRGARWFVTRLGERGLVLSGGIMAAVGLALGILTPWWPLFVVVEVMLGLGYFMLHSVVQARATEMLPGARGTSVSGFAFMLFLGQSLGALLLGAGIAALGYRTTFWCDAAGILLLGVWLWRLL